jgi:hypothetical protein
LLFSKLGTPSYIPRSRNARNRIHFDGVNFFFYGFSPLTQIIVTWARIFTTLQLSNLSSYAHFFFILIWAFVVHRWCWQRNENGTLNRQGEKDFWGGEACPARWPMRSNPVGQAELACDCDGALKTPAMARPERLQRTWLGGKAELVS